MPPYAHVPSGNPFQWDEIDHGLVSLKLSDLSEDIRRSIDADERRIRFENRNNANAATVPSQLLQMQEQRTDEWVRRTYEVYCDVWKVQGHTRSADFIRAVSEHGIAALIHVRTSTVIFEFELFAKRTRCPIERIKGQLDGFRRSMQRLESRWKRKLEIEAKECEHAQGFHQHKSHETMSDKIRHQRDELCFGIISIRRDQIPPIRRGELETLASPWMGATRERLRDFLDQFYQYLIEAGDVSEAEALSEYNGVYPSYADRSDWLKTGLERLQRSSLLASLLSQDRSVKRLSIAVAHPGCEEERAAVITGATQKGQYGRPSRLSSDFVSFAGYLWLNARHQSAAQVSHSNHFSKVTGEDLRRIASTLDSKGYNPPAKYLEKKYANELKSYNSRHSNSKQGVIKTWSQLVTMADKDQLRGMRKLLSRCADKIRSYPPVLSGN